MIFSQQLLFSDGQTVTATGPSTNTIDLGASAGAVLNAPVALTRDVGQGQKVPIVVQLAQDAADPADTIAVQIQVDDSDAFSAPRVVAESPVLTGGARGDRLEVRFPADGVTERFLRLNYVVTGSAPSYAMRAGIVAADGRPDLG